MTDVLTLIIPSLLGLITGGLSAYLTYRATKSRLDADASTRASQVDINLTEATQKIVDSAGNQITNIEKVMEERITNVQKTAELALKEVNIVTKTLKDAQEKILTCTRLVCELYTGAVKLIEQLDNAEILPIFVLPEVDKEIKDLIDKNGWH